MSAARAACLAIVVAMVPSRALVAQPLAETNVEEHLGRQLPLDVLVRDHEGRELALGEALRGDVPTLLVLAYYECPMLCGVVLERVARATQELGWPRDRYRLLTLSFNPDDTPVRAARKREGVLAAIGDALPPWPFLVASDADIAQVADALGFRAVRDPSSKGFAHPAVLFVLTGDGRISRYLYGVDYRVRDLELALIEAGQGKVGSSVERFLLTCFRYDPATRRYGPYVFGFLRAGAILIAVTLGIVVWRLRRRERSGAA